MRPGPPSLRRTKPIETAPTVAVPIMVKTTLRERFKLPSAARLFQTRDAIHLLMVTNVMPLTRLLASRKFPSAVTEVFRTMLPPPGIAQLWNFSVLGSKRTTVFGVAPDSLYQMMALIAEIPYGSDFGPLGDCHSVTLPVAGSRRPRYPREKSLYQTMSSLVIAMRRGRDAGSGNTYSRISSVLGSTLATLLVPNRTMKTVPFELTAMP